jgi:hypothetical protein
MTFIADIRHFGDAASFAAYLTTLPPPDWHPIGSTAHNTYRPTAAQWAGRPSMDGMVETYKAKTPVAWDRGPHLYFVVGAPNPAHNGIWQMTPPLVPGIHAGVCNEDHYGCELVGDYQSSAPPAALQTLFLDGLTVLHRWARIGAVLNAHRDCMPGRTCPGDAMYAIVPRLQAQLAVRLAAPLPGARITAEASILAPPRCTQAQAVAAILSQPHGGYTSGDIAGAIVPSYFATCLRVGVDPCIAIAQMIHETGNLTSFWSQRPQRNPAGIGVTGQTSKSQPPKGVHNWAWDDSKRLWCYGISFPSWVNDAIPAHVGRLLAYATKAADRTEAQQILVKQALSYRTLPSAYQGQAPSLRGLGGRWAVPGTNYPERLRTTAGGAP